MQRFVMKKLSMLKGRGPLKPHFVGAGRHPRSGQGFLPAPTTPSFFLALPKGTPLWQPRPDVCCGRRVKKTEAKPVPS